MEGQAFQLQEKPPHPLPLAVALHPWFGYPACWCCVQLGVVVTWKNQLQLEWEKMEVSCGFFAANQLTTLSLITCLPSSEVTCGPFKLICISEFSISPFRRLRRQFLINFTFDAPLSGHALDTGMTRRASTTVTIKGKCPW